MTIDELTRQLVAVYQAGKRHRFIRIAHAALAQVPAAPDLTAYTLRALTELGLSEAAQELLELRPEMCADEAQAAELRKALGTLPRSQVAWSELQATYERNTSIVAERFPKLMPIIADGCAQLRDVQVFRAITGEHYLTRRVQGKLREWLPPLSTTESDAEVQLPPRGQIPVPAIVGLSPGNILSELKQRTEKLLLTYSHALYVIEPDALRLAANLHVFDHTALLSQDRLLLFAGPNAIADFTEALKADPFLPFPQIFVDIAEAPECSKTLQNEVNRAAEQRNGKLADVTERLKQTFENRDAAYWTQRWKNPGTVLAITSRFTTVLQYATRDALAAFRHLGFDTELVIEGADHKQTSPLAMAEAIEQIDPDLILILDHLRYEYPHIPKNVPMLTWIQDPLPNLLSKQAGDSIGAFDFVCGILKPRCVEEFGYPDERFCSVEMPVSLAMFHDGPIPGSEHDTYACDLCFVSNASATVDELHAEAMAKYPAQLHATLQLLHTRVMDMLARGEFPYDAAVAMTRQAANEGNVALSDEQIRQLATFHTYRMLDWGRRQESLNWAADWAQRTGRTFKLYGRGWEKHPTLAPFAAGVIEHGEPLRRALRSAKLALQLIPSGIRHQRTYEILACGSLPITRYSERDFARVPIAEYVRRRDNGEKLDVEDLLPDLDRIAFETREQFESLVERYLANENARREVAEDLRQIVINHCTFDAAMQKVITAFRNRIEESAKSVETLPAGVA